MKGYISRELAIKAKKLGFNLITRFKFYTQKFEGEILNRTDDFEWAGIRDWNTDCEELRRVKNEQRYIDTISRPSYDQLAKWLEDKNMNISDLENEEDVTTREINYNKVKEEQLESAST